MLERTNGKVPVAVLRRAIAEALGWRAIPNPALADLPGLVQPFMLMNPSAEVEAFGGAEFAVWKHAPNYPADLNAAMGLLLELTDVVIEKAGDVVHVSLCPWKASAKPDQLALAICCAWWQWKTGEVVTVEEIES